MENIKHIYEGWYNTMLKALGEAKTDVEKRAEQRLKICEPCEFRDGYVCGRCGCPLISLVRSNKNCIEKKW